MKVLKGISLFFLYPLLMFVLGFWGGVRTTHFFYPEQEYAQPKILTVPQRLPYPVETAEPEPAKEVSVREERLASDTEYVIEENDVLRHTVVETSNRLPAKYVGMDREQFLAAMENYESFPPLAEMVRGFVSLEVLSFSRERVVVQMNYQYVQPGNSFYLAVQDNEVVVYLEDKKTLYINTGILLETLPEELQMEIIQMRYVEDEGKLYNFLETYSS